jgi:hypothetical protein
MTQFYAYLWLREDGTPYYAGKGCGRRAFKSAEHNVHCPKNNARIVIIPCETEAEAFAREIEMIDLYRRKDTEEGCLRNLTDGGEGAAGYQMPAERKVQLRGRTFTAETKTKLAASHRGLKHSSETRAKMRAAHLGVARQGRTPTAETKDKLSRAQQGKRHAPATLEKMRLASLAYWSRRRASKS